MAYLKPIEVCRLLDVTETTLLSWRARGFGPPFIQEARFVRYPEEDLNMWLSSRRRADLVEPMHDSDGLILCPSCKTGRLKGESDADICTQCGVNVDVRIEVGPEGLKLTRRVL